jgi:hypothetical protein
VDQKAEIIALIRRIQFDGGSNENLKELERATGNPDVWIIFDVLELEGMSPEKIYDLFCVNRTNSGKFFSITQ